jgi:large subunit ribosomal protein L24
MAKTHVKKNDEVLVLAGRDRGKTGKVLQVIPQEQKAIVERIHMVKKHTRPNPQKRVKGGIVEREGTIHISNLKVISRPGSEEKSRKGGSK